MNMHHLQMLCCASTRPDPCRFHAPKKVEGTAIFRYLGLLECGGVYKFSILDDLTLACAELDLALCCSNVTEQRQPVPYGHSSKPFWECDI